MKNCDTVMEKYLSLDKGQHIPFFMTLHLLACKTCRTQVRLLRNAEIAAAKTTTEPVQLNDTSIEAVMQKIAAQSAEAKKNPISLTKWIIGGIVMAILFLAYTMFTRKANSNSLKIYTYIELAALITAYCSLFIRSNMDFFVKLISTKIPSINFQAGRTG